MMRFFLIEDNEMFVWGVCDCLFIDGYVVDYVVDL